MINYPTDLQKFLISVSSFGNNLSGFLQAFPVVRVSLESVTSTEPGKSSGRFATFSSKIGLFWDGISLFLTKQSHRWDPIVVTSSVRIGYTTRRRG